MRRVPCSATCDSSSAQSGGASSPRTKSKVRPLTRFSTPGANIGDRVREGLLAGANVQPVEVARGDDRRNPPQRGDLRGERIVEGARRVDQKLAAPELDHRHARVEPGAAQSHEVLPQPQRIGNENF